MGSSLLAAAVAADKERRQQRKDRGSPRGVVEAFEEEGDADCGAAEGADGGRFHKGPRKPRLRFDRDGHLIGIGDRKSPRGVEEASEAPEATGDAGGSTVGAVDGGRFGRGLSRKLPFRSDRFREGRRAPAPRVVVVDASESPSSALTWKSGQEKSGRRRARKLRLRHCDEARATDVAPRPSERPSSLMAQSLRHLARRDLEQVREEARESGPASASSSERDQPRETAPPGEDEVASAAVGAAWEELQMPPPPEGEEDPSVTAAHAELPTPPTPEDEEDPSASTATAGDAALAKLEAMRRELAAAREELETSSLVLEDEGEPTKATAARKGAKQVEADAPSAPREDPPAGEDGRSAEKNDAAKESELASSRRELKEAPQPSTAGATAELRDRLRHEGESAPKEKAMASSDPSAEHQGPRMRPGNSKVARPDGASAPKITRPKLSAAHIDPKEYERCVTSIADIMRDQTCTKDIEHCEFVCDELVEHPREVADGVVGVAEFLSAQLPPIKVPHIEVPEIDTILHAPCTTDRVNVKKASNFSEARRRVGAKKMTQNDESSQLPRTRPPVGGRLSDKEDSAAKAKVREPLQISSQVQDDEAGEEQDIFAFARAIAKDGNCDELTAPWGRQRQQMRARIASLENDLDDAAEAAAKAEEERDALAEQNEVLLRRIKAMSSEMVERKGANDAAGREKKELTTKILILEHSLREAAETEEELASELDVVMKDTGEMARVLQRLSERNELLDAELRETKERASQDCRRLKDTIASLEAESTLKKDRWLGRHSRFRDAFS